ncbi:MAG: glutamine-hydrolyzing GMP synthase, partial [Ignavibacteria bacterium]
MIGSKELILIIDFGAQYSQLITRRIREADVYSEIYPHTISIQKVKDLNPRGIILSGGPMSVYDEGAPKINGEILKLGIPVLGICYGLQFICQVFGGKVEPASNREYGKAQMTITTNSPLLKGVSSNSFVWMSHGDYLTQIPPGFQINATSDHSPVCSISDEEKNIYGVQFHPEVMHTQEGTKIIRNFLFEICKCKGDWTAHNIIEESIKQIKERVNNSKAICALSGGVDSAVAAVLVKKAIGENLICVHIDTGLMRKNESRRIAGLFKEKLNLNVVHINASDKFLKNLEGIVDAEKKRKIIGNTFIEVFEEETEKYKAVEFLVQGTLYADVIES